MNIFTTLFIAFRRIIFDGIDDEEYDESDNLISNSDNEICEDSDVDTSNLVDYSLQSKNV